MRLVVFSNSSFSSASVRLGLQIMAAQLAERGHEVDYLALPAHPGDVFSPVRRAVWVRSWMKGGDRVPMRVRGGLSEYFLRAPFPKSRRYWHFESQIRLYSVLAPPWMKERIYDACIRDTAMSGLFSGRVRARVRVLRLNDNPDGLADDVHPMVTAWLKSEINAGYFDEIWPTSDGMLSKVQGLDVPVSTTVIPNGVFVERFARAPAARRRSRSAVYLGTFNHWFDIDLLRGAAELLPEWRIDLYGPYKRRLRPLLTLRNIVHHGPLPFDRVPETLVRYRVGLVPFAAGKAIVETMDPLKVNQYLAAGLGVASTSHGSLGSGLRDIARFGDDPAAFAAAVEDAERDCGVLRERDGVKLRLRRTSWSAVTDAVEHRLHRLLDEHDGGTGQGRRPARCSARPPPA